MIFRTPRHNVNHRRLFGDGENEQNRNVPEFEMHFPPFPEMNRGNNAQDNANEHNSDHQMDEREVHENLLDVGEQRNENGQQNELNDDDERRLLDQSNGNRGQNVEENLRNRGENRLNELVGNVTPRRNPEFVTSTPNISPIRHVPQINAGGNRRNWERPRDALGRFIRLDDNNRQEARNLPNHNANANAQILPQNPPVPVNNPNNFGNYQVGGAQIQQNAVNQQQLGMNGMFAPTVFWPQMPMPVFNPQPQFYGGQMVPQFPIQNYAPFLNNQMHAMLPHQPNIQNARMAINAAHQQVNEQPFNP
ncbi:hypothetical protein niasHT_006426 [Heterodera trifolii]|uniref:Uncharacterized protein n=1 Tax=Heterodera trifolii TaxID=157864 RepID=A0ABD2M3F9_9BILA